MEKFLKLLNEIFQIYSEKEEENTTARIEFRLTQKEKELYKAYCTKKRMTMSAFVRGACLNEIDSFITDHYRNLK